MAEHGIRGASGSRVAERAGISRTTFKKQFDSADDCFLALLDWMLERAVSLVEEAFRREPSWSNGVLAALEALLVFLDSEPLRARACLLERTAILWSRLRSRAEALADLGLLVDERARRELPPERQPPVAMSEATIDSVLGLLRRRLLVDEVPPFVSVLGPLAELVVAPYLGPDAAARASSAGLERSRALLEESSAPRPVEVPGVLRHGNSHRMRACMHYLADNPGASNEAIGAGIGISHAGQVSALLTRLRGAGLVEIKAGGAGRPNACRLSCHGAEVVRALRRW